MPPISELIDAIKAERKAWCRRSSALDMVGELHAELTKLIADERARLEAKVLPFREGDTVYHDRFGRGRVVCQTALARGRVRSRSPQKSGAGVFDKDGQRIELARMPFHNPDAVRLQGVF